MKAETASPMFALLLSLLFVSIFAPLHLVAQNDLAIQITYPPNNTVLPHCQDINITADIQKGSAEINYVIYYSGPRTLRRIRKAPWSYLWENVPNCWAPLWAKVVDKDGNEAVSDTVYLRVGDVEKGEKLINGGFDCRLWPWTTDTHENAKFKINMYNDMYFDDSTYAFIDIANGGDINWYLQLVQSCPLQAGHTYEISFMADAEMEKPIAFNFQQTANEWTVHYQVDLLITDEFYYGPFIYDCDVDDPTASFKFLLGANNISMMLDAVSIVDLNATSVDEKQDKAAAAISDFQLEQNYPNPFNLNTTIRFSLPVAAHAAVDIYNIHGQKVRSLADGDVRAGVHSLAWNGADDLGRTVPSGAYVYRVRVQHDDQFYQMCKKALLLK